MTEKELLEIEARIGKATAGPWKWCLWDKGREQLEGNVAYSDMSPVLAPHVCGACATRAARCLGPDGDDKAFIAHSREDIPALCAEVRRLKALAGEKE